MQRFLPTKKKIINYYNGLIFFKLEVTSQPAGGQALMSCGCTCMVKHRQNFGNGLQPGLTASRFDADFTMVKYC